MTLYEVLQVTETAPPEIIHAAYRALAKKYHPDLCRDNPEKAAEAMKNLNAAYAILSDPNKRSSYDLYLKSQRGQQEKATPRTRIQYTRPDPTPEPPPVKKEYRSPAEGKSSVLDKAYILSWIIVIGVVVTPIAIGAFSAAYPTSSNTYTPKSTETVSSDILQPITEPASGTILSGYEPYNSSQISVTASHTSSCLVKLKDVYDNEVISFYVRSGETAVVDVPHEDMYVFFASGKTWYGIEHLFGEDTYYSKDDTELDFSNYSWEYTLYPVEDGNFTQTTINAEEFN